MKYEISITIKDEADSLVVQEAADNKLREMYKEPRKNKASIRNVQDALFFLLPSPVGGSGVFYTRATVATVIIDDNEEECGTDSRQSCIDFIDALVAIAGHFVSVRTLSQ